MPLQRGQKSVGKTLVFLSTQEAVEFHYILLSRSLATAFKQLSLHRLHGNMQQAERTKVFYEFSKAKAGILLCTVSGHRELC